MGDTALDLKVRMKKETTSLTQRGLRARVERKTATLEEHTQGFRMLSNRSKNKVCKAWREELLLWHNGRERGIKEEQHFQKIEKPVTEQPLGVAMHCAH